VYLFDSYSQRYYTSCIHTVVGSYALQIYRSAKNAHKR